MALLQLQQNLNGLPPVSDICQRFWTQWHNSMTNSHELYFLKNESTLSPRISIALSFLLETMISYPRLLVHCSPCDPSFHFMDNFGAKGHTVVMSDLAASNFYELEGLKHAFTESGYRILMVFFAGMHNFVPMSSKAYELQELSFCFYPNKAYHKPVHVKIIFITHFVVK